MVDARVSLRAGGARGRWRTGPADYEAAAAHHRTCRRNGETVRKLIDCLIAAVAFRDGVPVLHADADFDVLARHTPLLLDAP